MLVEKVNFIWDEGKNRSNIIKHGISFERAKEAFYDDYSLVMEDTKHSIGEQRYVLIGMIPFGEIIVVCHCSYEHNIIRIISARKATRKEENDYYGYES